jgi:hypothetical protein
MQLIASARRRVALAAALTITALLLAGCSGESGGRGPNFLGTFRMGERVQAPPLVYNVLEADWKPALTEGGKAPKHRFLFIRLSATNSGGQTVAIPPFQLESTDGKTTYQEVTEGMEGVANWLGMLRSVDPAQTDQGYIVFDAPMAAYRLLMYDGRDVDTEKYAIVEIPVMLE